MNQSPLRLEHYSLKRILVEPAADDAKPAAVGSYADVGEAMLAAELNHSPPEDDGPEGRHSVSMKLELTPKESRVFPYRIEIHIVGIFDGHDLPADRRDGLVAANGATLLYGAARDMVLTLTMRTFLGAVLLPTVAFNSFGEHVQNAKKARQEKGPPTRVAAGVQAAEADTTPENRQHSRGA